MNLESILNNLITSGTTLSDPDISRKFKVLNIFQLIFIMLAPVLGLFYFYIGAMRLFYIMIIAGILMISVIILLRITKNIVLAANCAIFILWLSISVIAWNTGAITYEGVINPSWILNGGLVLLVIFLTGYLSGTVWATIIFLETGLVIHLYRNGHHFTNLIPPEISAPYFMGTYLVCLLSILLFAFLFEKEKSDALLREQEKSHTIRESKRYMDEIFDRYPLPTFVIDRSHRVVQWNRACVEISGIHQQDILGKRAWEGFSMHDGGSIADMAIDDIDSILENFSEEIITRTDSGWLEMDVFLPNLKGGQRAIVTAATITDNNGEVRGAIQTVQEVKKIPLEGGIRDSLDESFPKPVFRIDSRGKINFWNKACEDIFGYTSTEMIGESPLKVVAKRYRGLFKDTFNRVIKGESFTDREWRYVTKDGNPVYVLARIFPSHSADEEQIECIIENTDITDIRLKLKKISLFASENNEKLKTLKEEYDLLKKNIATFIRKKDTQGNE